MPLFSVIMPCYHSARWLRAALDSVFQQTETDFEVICVNDGSTDETLEILKAYGRGIKVLTQANLGAGSARNAAIKVATGDYLATLDSDDLWPTWTLRCFREAIEKFSKPAVVAGRSLKFRGAPPAFQQIDSRAPLFQEFPCYYDAAKAGFWFLLNGALAIRRDVVADCGGFAEGKINGEDTHLFLKFGTAEKFVAVRAPVLVGYRLHENNFILDAARTHRGTMRLIAQERAGAYPGGAAHRRIRRDMLTKHSRAACVGCVRRGQRREAWELYAKTFWWNAGLGRVKYLLSLPLLLTTSYFGRSNERETPSATVAAPRMLVFDVNIDTFQDLYQAESRLPRRVLYQYQVPDQARHLGWKNEVFTAPARNGEAPAYRLVRRILFPGWFCSLGWLTMPALALVALRHCKNFFGGKPDIAVFYNPYYLPMLKAIRPRVTVYHPIDDYTIYWPHRAARTMRLEDKIFRRSDLIVCTGKFMVDEFRKKYPEMSERIHHVPNPVPEKLIVPQPLPRTFFRGDGTDARRPMLGYVGRIADRLHEPVIHALAAALPWVDICFAPVPGEMQRRQQQGLENPFAKYPNVRFFEDLPKTKLIEFVRSLDVCLLPQIGNHYNKCASPRKLWEYLASSRPVVALNTPEAEVLAPYVHNAISVEDFVACVTSILLHGEPADYSTRRLELARQHTSTPLANRYAQLLKETCARKGVGIGA